MHCDYNDNDDDDNDDDDNDDDDDDNKQEAVGIKSNSLMRSLLRYSTLYTCVASCGFGGRVALGPTIEQTTTPRLLKR
jgi:hypothetical protein